MLLPYPDEQSGILTVSKLNQDIKTLLESHFPFVWVRGEISNFRVPASGHFYFTLKDEQSQIHAVFFRTRNKFLRFVPEAGMQVICQARVGVYEPRGEYQLVIEVMEPLGVGALQLAFEQLKKKLEAEGLFDPARKKTLPRCPRNICIVTSRTGAAIRDMLKVFQRSPYPLSVSLIPTAVQGAEAGGGIAAAVLAANELNRLREWDLLIAGRGGGSLEDLWAFNEEGVVRAIARCEIPVASAVGHEIDFTLADLAADVRMPTPTAAAEWVVSALEGFHRDLHGCRDRAAHVVLQRLETLSLRLRFLKSRLTHPGKRLESMKLLVDDRAERLVLAMERRLEKWRTSHLHLKDRLLYLNPAARIQKCNAELNRLCKELFFHHHRVLDSRRLGLRESLTRLETLSPLGVLRRGYSITYREADGAVVRSFREVGPGRKVLVLLAEGRLECRVEKAEDRPEEER